MMDNHWKEIAKNDLGLNAILRELIGNLKISKSDCMTKLNLTSKYELIRMESNDLIEFKDNFILLGVKPNSLIEYYSELNLKVAG